MDKVAYGINVQYDYYIGIAYAFPAAALPGTEITLTAEAYDEDYLKESYHFKEWQVISGNVTINENKFTMPAENVTIKAVFEENPTPPKPYSCAADTDLKAVWERRSSGGSGGRPTTKPGTSTETKPSTGGNKEITAANIGTVFADVQNNAWYSETKFAPNEEITREQLAAILYRYAQFKGQDVSAKGDLSSFADGAKASGWATEAMQWAVGAGLLNGNEQGKLVPTAGATRAEVAMILMRFMQA